MITAIEAAEPHHVPRPAAHVCAAYLDDEAVLYDTQRGCPLLLNLTAAAVWAELDGVRSVAAIATELAARFGASERTVLADLQATIVRLGELGLLAGVAPPQVA